MELSPPKVSEVFKRVFFSFVFWFTSKYNVSICRSWSQLFCIDQKKLWLILMCLLLSFTSINSFNYSHTHEKIYRTNANILMPIELMFTTNRFFYSVLDLVAGINKREEFVSQSSYNVGSQWTFIWFLMSCWNEDNLLSLNVQCMCVELVLYFRDSFDFGVMCWRLGMQTVAL